MRTRRGIRRMKFAAIGGVGIGISALAGVLMGQTAVSQMNPIYHGVTSTERPWRSSASSSAEAALAPPVASYADVPAYPSASDSHAGRFEDADALSDGWEQTVDAEYQRWQARIDVESRREEQRFSRQVNASVDEGLRRTDTRGPAAPPERTTSYAETRPAYSAHDGPAAGTEFMRPAAEAGAPPMDGPI